MASACLLFTFVLISGCSELQNSDPIDQDLQELMDTAGVTRATEYITVDNISQDYIKGTNDGYFYNYWKDKQFGNVGSAGMYVWISSHNR